MNYEDEFEADQFYSTQGQSMADIAGGIDEEGHLQESDLWGVQTKIFDISFSGSMEQFATDPRLTVFKLGSNMTPHLKHVTAMHNRDKARTEDREGNPAKAIILNAQVVEQHNDFPVKLGIKIKHLVPMVLGKNANNWSLNPYCPTQTVGKHAGHIFEPANIFKRFMYEKLDRLDTAKLAKEIRLDQAEDGYVPYRTDGISWRLLQQNVYDDVFPHFTEQFYDIEDELEASRRRRFKVDIPQDVASTMYKAIEAPLKEFEKSYVDLNDFNAVLLRDDGEAFNSTAGLIGEAYGSDADSRDEESSHNVTRVSHAGIKLKLSYVLKKE
jgi:hypothetical protein